MKVDQVPIGSITPYHQNPRRNDAAVDDVARSIREFGWRQPIVVDADRVIVIGHTRYRAALSLGEKKVPVHVAKGLDEKQVRELRIADNKTGERATWDLPFLRLELAELAELGVEDLTVTGLHEDELAALELGVETEEPAAEALDPAKQFGGASAMHRGSAPLRYWRENDYLEGDVLDFGAGHEQAEGVTRYDAFHEPDPAPLRRSWDVVMVNYVLNVQPADHLVDQILALVAWLARPAGRVLVAVVVDPELAGSPACGGREPKTRGEWAAILGRFLELEDVSPPGFCGFVGRPLGD